MRALLLSSALSVCLAFAPAAVAQDAAAMANLEQSMADAQAQAPRPGDEQLNCDQLQTEMVTTMQDPAVQSAMAANGADAQAQMDRMNEDAKDAIKAACDLQDPLASLWPILRFCVVGIVSGVVMATYYRHGFVIEKDGPALATVLTALGGFDAVKKWVTSGEL